MNGYRITPMLDGKELPTMTIVDDSADFVLLTLLAIEMLAGLPEAMHDQGLLP